MRFPKLDETRGMDGVRELDSPTMQDPSCAVLSILHRLLGDTPPGDGALLEILTELARAFPAAHAGIYDVVTKQTLARTGTSPLPWGSQASLLSSFLEAACGREYEGVSWLTTVVKGSSFLLWVEDCEDRVWTTSEMATLRLAAAVLSETRTRPECPPRWENQVRTQASRQFLEHTAAVTRRLAHDYGNILTGILGFTELIHAEMPEGSPLRSHLQEVLQAAQAGATLTTQLRLLSRRTWPPTEPTRLGTFFPNEQKRHVARFPEIRWDLVLPTDLPPVALSQEPLRILLGPLLENAFEAMLGTGIVTIRACPVTLSSAECGELMGNPSPGPHVEISILDDGEGISPTTAARLWLEPFFSTKPKRGGMGLAITVGTLQTLKGGFRLERRPEGGTAARVYLPVAPAVPTVERTPSALRILVVDDDPMILHFVCATLERAGYQVVSAQNGEEALRKYRESSPEVFHLVLTDVVMPRMDGFELADRLCRQDPAANLLFMSGQVSPEVSRRDFHGKSFALLTKPFRTDGLLRSVRGALERAPKRLTLPPAPADGTVLSSARGTHR